LSEIFPHVCERLTVVTVTNKMSPIATRQTRKRRPHRSDITVDDFEFICVLGRGSWAKVSKVKLKSTGDVYALKSYSIKKIHEQDRFESVKDELRIHRKIDHPFIAHLHFAFMTKKKLYLVMDYVSGGDLFFHLQQQTRFPLDVAKSYIAEIILAVDYLHRNQIIKRYVEYLEILNILKRALKPEDIGIDEHGHIKLFDIGLALDGIVDYKHRVFDFCGTPEYVSTVVSCY
jgi:serine/threonine protein kinase